MAIHRVSNNVGLCQALFERTTACTQRRAPFRSPFPTVGSLVIVFQVRNSVRPMHLFGHNRDHDYYFELKSWNGPLPQLARVAAGSKILVPQIKSC